MKILLPVTLLILASTSSYGAFNGNGNSSASGYSGGGYKTETRNGGYNVNQRRDDFYDHDIDEANTGSPPKENNTSKATSPAPVKAIEAKPAPVAAAVTKEKEVKPVVAVPKRNPNEGKKIQKVTRGGVVTYSWASPNQLAQNESESEVELITVGKSGFSGNVSSESSSSTSSSTMDSSSTSPSATDSNTSSIGSSLTSLLDGTYGAMPDAGETDEPNGKDIAYSGNVYYIDCEQGNDSANGMSPSKAWRSSNKVLTKTAVHYWDTVKANTNTVPKNHEPWVAAPSGSAFLFKRGCSFNGYISVHAWTASGYSDNLTFGAYGDPAKPRPILHNQALNSKYANSTVVTNGHSIHLKNLQIMGDATNDHTAITVSNTTDTSIENCVITNAPRDGILAENTINLQIRNTLIVNNQLSGGRGGGLAGGGTGMHISRSTFINNGRDRIGAHNLYVRHLHDAVIEGNLLEGGSNLGLVLHGSSSNVVIRNNMIRGNSNGIDVTGGYAEKEVFDKIVIANNIIKDNGFREGEQGYGLLLKSMTNSIIVNNVVSGNRSGGMVFQSNNPGDPPSNNVLIAHNTFSEPTSSYGNSVSGAGMEKIAILNNIFQHLGKDRVILDKSANVKRSSLMMDHNLYYMPNRADKNVIKFNGDLFDINELKVQFAKEANGLYGNPLFKGDSFSVKYNSPAKGAGREATITTDFDGLSRSNRPTIGAYEVN
jgi:hypothetical protein